MKLSDYVINFVENITDSIFLLSGGGIMHLVDSVRKSKLNAYCCHHEQAAATAAEGYARIKNDLGVVLVTTGPGATNAITGAASAWLDSIPMLVISGQVKTDNIAPRRHGVLSLRQLGFQELNIIDLVKPITNYATMIEDKDLIRFYLEKAVYLAKSGRPGPVWIDIPLDIQAADINVNKLHSFTPCPASFFKESNIPIDMVVDKLKQAKKPLMMVGNGVRLSGAVKELQRLLNKLQINVVSSFTGGDIIIYDYPYYLGKQGMPGNIEANYAIDNCDLLLIIGERLQLIQTSYDYQKFASGAFKIMVDIDGNELFKKTVQIDLPICGDAKAFIKELSKVKIRLHRWDIKVKNINPNDYQGKKNYLNIYKFFSKLSRCSKGYHVATANGMSSLTTHQALRIVRHQRLITNVGLGQMGSGLPLAIGACIASGKKPTICMEGDGSLMLNIQDLQTVIHHKLPLKIFIFNNDGYYSIRSTHKAYFNKVFAADSETGVSLPNFEKLIKAWGLEYRRIANDRELYKIEEVMNYHGPVVCELMIDPNPPLLPKWTAGQYKEN